LNGIVPTLGGCARRRLRHQRPAALSVAEASSRDTSEEVAAHPAQVRHRDREHRVGAIAASAALPPSRTPVRASRWSIVDTIAEGSSAS
jgi:hypothetical protein